MKDNNDQVRANLPIFCRFCLGEEMFILIVYIDMLLRDDIKVCTRGIGKKVTKINHYQGFKLQLYPTH